MKFLIIGLGSMGKRRIRNLQYLKEKDIIGFDMMPERCKESEDTYGIKTYTNIDEALSNKPDALIISTPPQYLIEYEIMAAKKKIPFFSETGVYLKNHDKLRELVKKNKVIAVPSSTFRFNPSVRKIKQIINSGAIGKVCAVTYHMGQYALDWHPWENIKESYLGNKDTSGPRKGIPFEFGWLVWLFGPITSVSCLKGKNSNLDLDIDDIYQLSVEFKNGAIGNVITEVISRTPLRILRIVGDEGTLIWDWLDDTVKVYTAKDKKWTVHTEDVGFKEKGYIAKENMYIDEIKNFLDILKATQNKNTDKKDVKKLQVYTLEEEYSILKITDYAEESFEKKKRVNLK